MYTGYVDLRPCYYGPGHETMTIDDFITGENFIAAADFVFTPTADEAAGFPDDYSTQVNTFGESGLAQGNTIVYTPTMYTPLLFEKIRQLPFPYVVVSHNSDTNVRDTSNVPPNVTLWFSQNVCTHDRRLVSLPIGLENNRWFPEVQKKNKMLQKMQAPRVPRNLLYVNHNVETNVPERAAPYEMLENKPFVTIDHGSNPRNFDGYIDNIYNHTFVLSPPGNGVDTHRKWEALYLGAIPVEKRCPNNTYYQDLPICFVDSWEQVTEDFLNLEYARITGQQWDLATLKMTYWLGLIRAAR